jgi:hypothetical protein
MRLFHILTRHVATCKIKVTKKLLNRVRRETDGKHRTEPPKQRGGNHHKFVRSRWGEMAAALLLFSFFVTAKAALGAPPDLNARATTGYSAAALFNQANAYARNGKTGVAILDYERAQLLAPNDADIAANLHFVRAKAGLPEAPENWLTRSLTCVRPNTLAWTGSFGLVLAGLSLLLVRLQPQHRVAFGSLTFAGAFLVASAIGSAITMWPKVNEAVVIARDAPAWNSPVPVAEPAFKLPEGETVTVRAERQDFALVQTSAGRAGWVARADLARVVPPSANSAPLIHRT